VLLDSDAILQNLQIGVVELGDGLSKETSPNTTKEVNYMDYKISEETDLWKDFLSSEANLQKMKDVVVSGAKSMVVDFNDIKTYNADLGREILNNPTATISYANTALLETAYKFAETPHSLQIQIIGLQKSKRTLINDFRSIDVGKFIAVPCRVKKTNQVRPLITIGVFRCVCGHTQRIHQYGESLRKPFDCPENEGGCGRKGRSTTFTLMENLSSFIDSQEIVIERRGAGEKDGKPIPHITAYLEGDLTGQLHIGDEFLLNGILSLREIRKGTPTTTHLNYELKVNSIEVLGKNE